MKKKNRKRANQKNETSRVSVERTVDIQQIINWDSNIQKMISDAILETLSKMKLEKSGDSIVFSQIEDHQEDARTNTSIWKRILLVLELLVCPFSISKHHKIDPKVHDVLLSTIISTIMMFSGFAVWLSGGVAIVWGIWVHNLFGVLGLFALLIGSMLIVSADSFGREQDSNKIYAFSASIFALFSCIASWIAACSK